MGADAVLKHVARVFDRSLREGDVPARVGTAEFALWLPGASLAHAMEVAERVRRAVASIPFVWGGSDVKLSCSVGVAAVPEAVREGQGLFAAAALALRDAWSRGENRIEGRNP